MVNDSLQKLRALPPNPLAMFIIHALNVQYGAMPRYLGF